MDLLGLPRFNAPARWYENDGAYPPSFTSHSIGVADDRTVGSILAADLDGDGDLDVVAGWTFVSRTDPTFYRAELTWYQREPGSPPSFMAHSVLTSGSDVLRSVAAADVDMDGKIDLIGAWSDGDKVAWYKNSGTSPLSFSERVITVDPDGPLGPKEGYVNFPQQIVAAHMDGDGDTDIASASFIDDTIAWFEQLGGSGPYFQPHSLGRDADGAVGVHLSDLDGDGHLDVLSVSQIDDRFGWYQNRTTK